MTSTAKSAVGVGARRDVGRIPETRPEEFVRGFLASRCRSTQVEAPAGGDAPEMLHVVLSALGPLLAGSVYFMDRSEGRIVYTTEHMLGSLGYSSEQIQAMSLEDIDRLVHPRDRRVTEEGKASFDTLQDDGIGEIGFRIRGGDGRWRWLEGRERVMTRTPDGRVKLTLGIVRDVTARQLLRDALASASRQLQDSEDNERRRIARDLHDSTGQLLAAARLLLAPVQDAVGEDQRETVQEVRRIIEAAHQEIRTLSYTLHPPQLERDGLRATLKELTRGFGKRSGLGVRFSVEGEPRRVGPAIELAMFRVAQEALLNAHKHAYAETVDVRLRFKAASVSLEIEDDGVGLDASGLDVNGKSALGVGLPGMKARLAQLGGRLHLSRRGRGLRVRAVVQAPEYAPRPDA